MNEPAEHAAPRRMNTGRLTLKIKGGCTETRQTTQHGMFSGAFAKLRKAKVSFLMPVCSSVYLSVGMEQLGYHWADFDET